MSEGEIKTIVASFFALSDRNFNCSDCKKKMGQVARDQMKGCSKTLDKPVFTWNNKINFSTCPVNHYNHSIGVLMEYFRHFERGVLPFNGGLLDQPAKTLEVFNLFESLKTEMEIDAIKKREKANKKVQSKWQTKLK